MKKELSGRWYVGDIRGAGLFWAIELVKNKQTKEPFPSSQGVGFGIYNVGISEPYSLSVYPGGGHPNKSTGDNILLAPPYICSIRDINFIVTTLGIVLDDFFSQGGSPKEFE